MARNKKNILNQIVRETKKEETKVGWVNPEPKVNISDIVIKELEKNHGVDAVEELKEVVKVETKSNSEISLKVSGEKLAEVFEKNENPEYNDDGEIDGDTEDLIVEEIKTPRGIRDISKDEIKKLKHKDLRMFRRTGRLPK